MKWKHVKEIEILENQALKKIRKLEDGRVFNFSVSIFPEVVCKIRQKGFFKKIGIIYCSEKGGGIFSMSYNIYADNKDVLIGK